jgi:aspartyl-tRNA(Asn)/glutamyl-tRNA(Gln) amidotransferase subunit A
MELTSLTLVEALDLIQQGQISPVELTEAHLQRIERIDPLLNCFITVTPELAMQQARQAEQILLRSSRLSQPPAYPLLGIPVALKDLFETRGVSTTAGSTFLNNHVPLEDAVVVKKIRQAGAIILGKLNMHEIALGVTNVNPHFGACRNPWDRSRITGGSSGGSAAALAADLCIGSLGTDSGGSIRIPASLCGIVGLKPTYGRVSLRGIIPLSWNTDHAGPMAKCTEDVALLLHVIAGYDSLDPYSIKHRRGEYLSRLHNGVRGWRIALAMDEYFDRTDAQVWQAIETAGQVFKALGASVELVEFPSMLQGAQANVLMVTSDAAAYHQERLRYQPDGFGEDVLRRLQAGAAYTSTEYIQARRTQTILRRQFARFLDSYDILLLPTTPVAAPLIEGPDAVEQAHLLTRYTAPFNLTGLPALSLPCGFTNQGLPIGLQLVARPWAEASLLQAAYAYEQAAEWLKKRPSLDET